MSQSMALFSPLSNVKPHSAAQTSRLPSIHHLPLPLLPCKFQESTYLVKLSLLKATFLTAARAPKQKLVAAESSPDLIHENVAVGQRKWNLNDMATAGVVGLMHFLCVLAPFYSNWGAFWVAFGLYFVTGLLGITLSFHRNLSHRSFKLPKWLEYFCAYCGALALQGNPIDWVSTHRYHHQFCDSEKDPHSPIDGFWFSHLSWLFDTDKIIEKCGEANNVGDLEKQPFYRFLRSSYILHPIGLAILLYALGGFPFIVWGMGVRVVWVYHITWFVNSACHIWGKQAWNTGDLSKNNWWVGLLAFGEGWHNNHHAFEYSARHGLELWQIDMTWYVVRFLQIIGSATDVKLPTEAHKQRLAFD